MSIAPPSDIILDVAQAADPTRRQAAIAKLAQAAAQGGTPPVDFQTALGTTTPAAHPATPTTLDPSLHFAALAGAGRSQLTSPHGATYQKFEAMVLRNFVENILPKDSELFGDKTSADAYRSMMADKIADQMAKAGGIGIARMIERYQTHDGASAAAAAAAVSTATKLTRG